MDYDTCKECNGPCKKGKEICGKCLWIQCLGCEKFILKAKGYARCFACHAKLGKNAGKNKNIT